jgi:hypothetical protein
MTDQLTHDERQFLEFVRSLSPAAQSKLERLMKRGTDQETLNRLASSLMGDQFLASLPPVTTDELIAEAEANEFEHAGERDPVILKDLLPGYLHDALDFLLRDFDYDADRTCGQAQAARILTGAPWQNWRLSAKPRA